MAKQQPTVTDLPERQAGERLGHSSVTITEQVYLKHLTPEQALAAKMARTA